MPKTNKLNFGFCLFLFVCIVFVSISPYFLFPQINKRYVLNRVFAKDDVFLELWNVDTFEGGTNSRSRFLEKCAVSFEKENRKQYIIVQNLTREELLSLLSQDKVPDILSFGVGLGELVRSYCCELNIEAEFRNNIQKSGEYNKKQLSVPWCVGGYVFCGDVTPDCVVGVGVENNLPPTISQNKKKYSTQYEAYKGFLNKEFDVLLGTQRDFYRLSNKLELGVIDSCDFSYVETYSDLLQHFSVCSKDDDKFRISCEFINYVLSLKIQEKLTGIGMFSVLNKAIYSNTNCEEFEQAIFNVSDFGKVFDDDAKREDLMQKY